jgi:hypothetical protein
LAFEEGKAWRAKGVLDFVHDGVFGPMRTTLVAHESIFCCVLMIFPGKCAFIFSNDKKKFDAFVDFKVFKGI